MGYGAGVVIPVLEILGIDAKKIKLSASSIGKWQCYFLASNFQTTLGSNSNDVEKSDRIIFVLDMKSTKTIFLCFLPQNI